MDEESKGTSAMKLGFSVLLVCVGVGAVACAGALVIYVLK